MFMQNRFLVLAPLVAVCIVSCFPLGADAQEKAPSKVKVTLRDKSQLVGVPGVASFELVTGFGKIQVPFTQVTALDFTKDGVTVKLTNKDVLTGTLAGTAFEIETAFGKVSFPYAQIESLRPIAAGAQGAGSQQDLLLHAKFDSDTEDLDAFNARLETRNARVIEDNDRKGMLFDAPAAKAIIDLPFSPYTMPEGTIEFWAKLPEPNRRFNSGGGEPWFFNIERVNCDEGVHIVYGFVSNNGAGQGGLTGIIWHYANAGTHHAGGVGSIADTKVLGDNPDGWHHYSFVWKWDGLDIPEAKQAMPFLFPEDRLVEKDLPVRTKNEQVLALTVDGKVVASAGKVHYYKNHLYLQTTETKCRFLINEGTAPSTTPFVMADCKIWNHAQLPVVAKE